MNAFSSPMADAEMKEMGTVTDRCQVVEMMAGDSVLNAALAECGVIGG